jgi:hypothetical protein
MTFPIHAIATEDQEALGAECFFKRPSSPVDWLGLAYEVFPIVIDDTTIVSQI